MSDDAWRAIASGYNNALLETDPSHINQGPAFYVESNDGPGIFQGEKIQLVDAGLVLDQITVEQIAPGLAGLHLSISAAVGFIALAGISVQNGVIMVEQIKHLILEGYTVADAILEGAVVRLRPILMTALMAGLGLLPAALSHGIGSETQRPFAVVIVGGLVTATFFTLLLLPLLFPSFSDEVKGRKWEPKEEQA
jgi:hypothetical protein